jgi:hypothetical protein
MCFVLCRLLHCNDITTVTSFVPLDTYNIREQMAACRTGFIPQRRKNENRNTATSQAEYKIAKKKNTQFRENS